MQAAPLSYSYDHVSKETLAKLKAELNENPENVNAHISSLHRYVKSIPHLTCPMDPGFLLRFLRVSKFDHQRAQKRIDNFCTCRRSTEQTSNIQFRYPQVGSAKFQELLAANTMTKLGYNQKGEIVMLVQAGGFNIEKTALPDYMTAIYMNMDVVAADENAQMNGFCILVDLSHITQKSMMAFGDPKNVQPFQRNLQECYPIRNKSRIFTNEPLYFEIIFNIFQFFVNEKQRARAFRLKQNMKDLESKMPGLTAILPQEYNGGGGPLSEIKARWENEINAHYKNGDPLDGIIVNEALRPAESKNLFVQYSEYKGEILSNSKTETKGTYTKFDD